MESESEWQYLKQLIHFRANLALDSWDICFEAANTDTTENRRRRMNLSIALLECLACLGFEMQDFKLFLIESLPELRKIYSTYPVELQAIAEKVISQVEKIIES